MSDPRRSKRKSSGSASIATSSPDRHQNLLFVHQSPAVGPSNRSSSSGSVASQARRWQTERRHQGRRVAAQQGASYARSLVGWRSNAPSTTGALAGSSRTADLDIETGNPPSECSSSWQHSSEALQLSLNVSGGLRNDPFGAFPTASNTKEVMQMVDYYINVWSPQKMTAFDTSIGFNANITLCWPVALQDNMLFDATIAVARVAYCLSVNIAPAEDEFMLYHRGTALTRLRERVSARAVTDEEVVFTIARMLSIAYMSGDLETWDIHFRAFREAAEKYLSRPETEISQVIAHRLRSWRALHDFRTGLNPLRDDFGSPTGNLSYLEATFSTTLPATILRMSIDLKELAMTGYISSEVIEIASTISDTIDSDVSGASSLELWVAAGDPTRLSARLLKILIENDLMDKELILCCGLVALSLQIHHLCARQESTDAPPRTGSPPKLRTSLALKKLADTFINKTFTLDIELQKRLFIWSSIVLGSVLLLHYDDLRVKGHIILVNLATKLRPTAPKSEITHTADWMSLKPIMQGFIYHDRLAEQWRSSWKHSMEMQEEWEENGLLKICTPGLSNGLGVDIVEYMVLRDARESLPILRKILVH